MEKFLLIVFFGIGLAAAASLKSQGPLPESCFWLPRDSGSAVCTKTLPDFSPYDPDLLTSMRRLFVRECDEYGSTPALTLTNATFANLPGLLKLVIDCPVEKIEAGALQPLTQLETLSLNGAGMVSGGGRGVGIIPPGLLCGLSNLTTVSFNNGLVHSATSLGLSPTCATSASTCNSPNITMLSVADNPLRILKKGLFLCNVASTLLILNASNAQLKEIEDGAFANATSLRWLYLSNNSLATLPPGLLSNATSLIHLDLSSNRLGPTLPKTLLQDVVNLHKLSLADNRLRLIHPTTFASLASLTDLDLSDNLLIQLDANALNLPSLSSLNLTLNHFSEVTNATFAGVPRLDHLSMESNVLQTVDPAAFATNRRLTVVSFNNNQLTVLPSFNKSYGLLALYASNNSIASLSPDQFVNNSRLLFLSLNNNQLKSIDKATFQGLYHLLKLDLSHNQLSHVDNGSFDSLSALKFLFLQENNLTLADQEYSVADDAQGPDVAYNQPMLFTPLSSLMFLNLSTNAIHRFSYDWFPFSLVYLSLSNNDVAELPVYDDFLNPTPHLHTLDLSGNVIANLSASHFPPSLLHLILSSNKIKSVDKNAFSNLINLDYLFLRNNLLSTLPQLSMGNSLTTLTLRDNPWTCDCNMAWLTQMQYLNFLVHDIVVMKCRSPMNRTADGVEVPMLHVKPDDFLCPFRQTVDGDSSSCVSAMQVPGTAQAFGESSSSSSCVYRCPARCTCYHNAAWTVVKIECTGAGLDTLPSDMPKITKTVYVDGNQIVSVEVPANGPAVVRLDGLEDLYMNSSGVKSLGDGALGRLAPNLLQLYLDHNSLTTVSEDAFEGLGQLQTLDLSNNMLSDVAESAFAPLASLQSLNLQANRLATYPVWSSFASLPSLAHLGLVDNPWSCDCAYAQKYREWLHDYLERVHNVSRLMCTLRDPMADPPLTHNVSLTLFNSTHCYDNLYLTSVRAPNPEAPISHGNAVAISLSICISIVVLVAGVLAYVYRSELKFAIEKKFGVRLL